MSSVNKVILVGHLGKDPELRQMPSGQGLCVFSVATSSKWTDKTSGQEKEQTEWHNIVMRDKLAEIGMKYLKKGALIYIEGRLRTRKWEDKEGKDRYTTEVTATSMQMLGSKTDAPGAKPSDAGEEGKRAVNSLKQGETGGKPKGRFDDMEDDIPF